VSAFFFSPRPNRAHEIRWRAFDDEAFAEALVQDKPILLAIGAGWCHSCHVMDETTYSHPEVIALLNREFVPVRVDADQRPDVNDRYNTGGLPSTAVLTPAGYVLTGATCIPPEAMLSLLHKALETYRQHRNTLRRLKPRPPAREPVPETLTLHPYRRLLVLIRQSYDPEFGGFGREAKLPMAEALELALHRYVTRGDQDFLRIAAHSLNAMSGGGLYDPVQGGFFRASATRDWRTPRDGKTLEDNARLLRLFLMVHQVTGNPGFAAVARDVLRYLDRHLYLPEVGVWAGSEYAGQEYYHLAEDERKEKAATLVDRHIYVDRNALAAEAFWLAGVVLDDDGRLRQARATLESLWRRAHRPGQGLAHYLDADFPRLFGRLEDQVAAGRACLALYQVSGEAVWLERAAACADFCREKLFAPGGGFYDRPPDPGAPGALAVPLLELPANAAAARLLLALAAVTGRQHYREAAEKTLAAFARSYRHHGLLAAGYALAVWEALRPWTVVNVVGAPDDRRALDLRRAALRVYRPATVVRTVDRRDRLTLNEMGLRPSRHAVAVVTEGVTRRPPVHRPEELATLLRPPRRER